MKQTRKESISAGLVHVSRLMKSAADEETFNDDAEVSALFVELREALQAFHMRLDNMLYDEMRRERGLDTEAFDRATGGAR